MRIADVAGSAQWDELTALFEKVFGAGDAALWQRFHGRPPFCRPEWCKVVVQRGRIVSHACWVPRALRIGSAVIRAGAVGYVATDPALRGHGLAGRLLTAWTRELVAAKQHLSFVTGIPRFYERFGYEIAFPFDWMDAAVASDAARFRTGDDSPSVRIFAPADLDAVTACYDLANATRTGSLLRSREYWDWLLTGLRSAGLVEADGVWVVDGRRGVRGYGLVHRGPLDALELWEAATCDETAVGVLLASLASRADAEHKRRLELKLPLDHPVTRHALARGALLTGYSDGIHARLLDLLGLFEALRPELDRRLQDSAQSDLQASLVLATDTGTVTLELDRGTVRVCGDRRRGHIVEMPQSFLVKLVTGYADARWAAAAPGTSVPAAALPILRALFPKGTPYMWNADVGY